MNTMQLEGFLAEIEIDEEADLLRGTVVNAHEVLKFQGTTVGNLQAAFKDAIKAYHDQCRSNGNNDAEPARPVSKEMHNRMLRSARLGARLRPGGAPNYWTLQEAYDELLAGLGQAHDAYKITGDNGLEGAKMACQKIGWFMARRWENPELAAPFLTLLGALTDRQMKGEQVYPEIFNPEQPPPGRLRSSYGHYCKMFAAALLHAARILKLPLKKTAEMMAIKIGRWPAFTRIEITADTLINWRTSEKEKLPSNRKQFDQLVAVILKDPRPELLIERFLKEGPPSSVEAPADKNLDSGGGM